MPFPSLENDSDLQYASIDIQRTLKYLDAHPELPSSRGVDFPHIIDTQPVFNELTDPVKLRLCDGVATVLFHYDAAFLSQFLDLSISEVFFLREENTRHMEDLVIYRNHRTVTVSLKSRHLRITILPLYLSYHIDHRIITDLICSVVPTTA